MSASAGRAADAHALARGAVGAGHGGGAAPARHRVRRRRAARRRQRAGRRDRRGRHHRGRLPAHQRPRRRQRVAHLRRRRRAAAARDPAPARLSGIARAADAQHRLVRRARRGRRHPGAAAGPPRSPCPAPSTAGGKPTPTVASAWAPRWRGATCSPTRSGTRARASAPPPASARRRRASPTSSATAPSAEIRRWLWPLYHPDALRRGPLVQADLARRWRWCATAAATRSIGASSRGAIAAAAADAGSPLTADDLRPSIARTGSRRSASPTRRARRRAFRRRPRASPRSRCSASPSAFDLGALGEADYVHVLVEAAKLAFEDRDRYLTDPAAMTADPAELLAPRAPRRAPRAASRMTRAPPRAPPRPPAATPSRSSPPTPPDNAVALVQSLYFTFGSGLVAGDTGVMLQNRGSFFSLDPASVNALAPGKRTMHTLMPCMYLEDGRPRFVSGTMGGEGQPQTQAALLTRRLHRGLGAQAAVEAPRWLYGRTWGLPSRSLHLEGRYPAELARGPRRARARGRGRTSVGRPLRPRPLHLDRRSGWAGGGIRPARRRRCPRRVARSRGDSARRPARRP